MAAVDQLCVGELESAILVSSVGDTPAHDAKLHVGEAEHHHEQDDGLRRSFPYIAALNADANDIDDQVSRRVHRSALGKVVNNGIEIKKAVIQIEKDDERRCRGKSLV